MRNSLITASYLKDLLDFMKKFHLSNVTIDSKFKLSVGEEGYCLTDLQYYYDLPSETISSTDKKEFIEKFKMSGFYKEKIYGESRPETQLFSIL